MSLSRDTCAVALTLLASSAGAGEIRGRALVDGRPAGGLTVSVMPFEDGLAEARRDARREPPAVLATTSTRADGAFVLPVSAPSGTAVYLGFAGGGSAAVRLEPLVEAAGEDLGDVRLPRAAPLAGRVVGERGLPVVGAVVTLYAGRGRGFVDLLPVAPLPQASTTAADGTFRFEAASEEGNRLRVEAPGFATVERSGVRAGALTRPVRLGLGQVVRGTVRLPDGRTPAAGAIVRFEGRDTTRPVETRPDGAFVLDSVPREPGSLVADAGERGRAATALAAGSGEPVTVVLAPTTTLAGRVVDAEGGGPLAGVRLLARGASGGAFLARSGTDGGYALRGLPPQRYTLAADDERFVPWTRAVALTAGRPERQDVPLVRGATLAGRVVAEDGAPIEGATLQLTRGGESPIQAFVRTMQGEGAVRSGRDGSFRAKRLPPGLRQRLDARHDEFEERSLGGIDLSPGAARTGVTVVMRRGLSLRGVVKDEAGRPLAGADVRLSRARTLRAGRGGMQMSMIGPGSEVRRETGADGRFEFRGLSAGEYSLAARRPGFARAALDVLAVNEARAAEPVELVLRPGSAITRLRARPLGQRRPRLERRGARLGGRLGPGPRPGLASHRGADRARRAVRARGARRRRELRAPADRATRPWPPASGCRGPGRRDRARGQRDRPDPRPRGRCRERASGPRLRAALRAGRPGRDAHHAACGTGPRPRAVRAAAVPRRGRRLHARRGSRRPLVAAGVRARVSGRQRRRDHGGRGRPR